MQHDVVMLWRKRRFGMQRNGFLNKAAEVGQMLAFFVAKHIDHAGVRHHRKMLWAEAARLGEDFAQDVVTHGAWGLYVAAAVARRTRFGKHLRQRFSGALAG